MRRREAGRLVLAAGLVLLAGCASLWRRTFDEPVVTFRNVVINGLGTQGGNMDVELSVYNPNGYRLDGLKLSYTLLVDSTLVGTGALDGRFTVPARDSTVVQLPVDFTYRGLGSVATQLLRTGTVVYRVRGDVTVGTPIGTFTRPYDRVGRFRTATGTAR